MANDKLSYRDFIVPSYKALLELGGSGTIAEIHDTVVNDLKLPDEIVDIPHLGSTSMTELKYQLAWARTYLKNFGVITNSRTGVWAITPDYMEEKELDAKEVIAFVSAQSKNKRQSSVDDVPEDSDPNNDITEFPDEVQPWREQLSNILHNMDPFGFERLSMRLLRECGFSDVKVTKKTGDGGIDGTGKLKINGIFSFNVAFQCKRFAGSVSAGDIRDFRGSLTTDIEKGLFITTGTFSKPAIEEACNPGKQQIDLIDGEEFISKLAEYGIGVQEVRTYEINSSYFETI